MNARVCIFAAESLLHWAGFYVRAFRSTCDVIAIGPAIDPAEHDFPEWDRVAGSVIENDIHSTTDSALKRLALLPPDWNPDLLVVIQSGDTVMKQVGRVGCPTVYISVDTWHDPREYQHAYQYDFVFVAQKEMAKYMRKMGCCRVFWLPLACDLDHHYAVEGADLALDVAFIGSTHFYVNRQRRARLERVNNACVLGTFYGLGPVEMAEVYGRTRCVFNSSISKDVNMRVYEALSTGRPLLTNRDASANGLFEQFEEGVHLFAYDDDDLEVQLQAIVSDPDRAAAIGRAGQALVHGQHTYRHRVTQLLAAIEGQGIPLAGGGYGRERNAANLSGLLAHGSSRVLDMGLGLMASRIRLRRMGIRHVAGMTHDAGLLTQRAKSYDVAWLIDAAPTPTGDYDTVVWGLSDRCGFSLERTVQYSRSWLVEGGRILFWMSDDEYVAACHGESESHSLREWSDAQGCRVLWCSQSAATSSHHLVSVALISQTEEEVLAEVYREFPVNGIETDPSQAFSPGEEPDSPVAEGP